MELELSQGLILQTYIVGQGLMTDQSDEDDWPLYISSMPDVKTNCGAIYSSSGKIDGKLSNGEVVQHPGIQLRIRSNVYETGYAKIEEITLALDGVNKKEVSVDGFTYQIQNVSRGSTINSESDAKRRFLFTVNFMVTLNKVV